MLSRFTLVPSGGAPDSTYTSINMLGVGGIGGIEGMGGNVDHDFNNSTVYLNKDGPLHAYECMSV